MRWRRALPWLTVFAILGLLGAGLDDPDPPALGPRDQREGRVTRVVDGDTVKVLLERRAETVRYIGVDAPESVKPGAAVECFGHAASSRNRRLIAGQKVRLLVGEEPRDRFGRLLAYVYRARDGRFINAELVRDGYARTLTIAPNDEFAAPLERREAAARGARRGLWRACPA